MLKVPSNIVDCHWLHQHLNDKNLVVLDATIPKVTASSETKVLENLLIPFSRFFDIKSTFSKKNADFPNTMLEAEKFEEKARQIGIRNTSCIVIYDKHGVYSSPRAWWMFKSMGFDNVAVLNGGLPVWISKGYQTVSSYQLEFEKGDFKSNFLDDFFVNHVQVYNKINSDSLIVDARSRGRFHGTSPEPRKEVRGGHIPSSVNLPYSEVISGYQLKTREELDKLFIKTNDTNKPMIFSCGSGITACVLALAADTAGRNNFSVYDGSWTEWGSKIELPIEK